MRIAIEPIWCFTREGDPEPMHLALEFLNSIQITGTINEAADLSNLSGRHALNLLDKWSAFFLTFHWSSLRACRRGRFAFSDSNLNVPILEYPTSRASSRLSKMAKRSRSICQLPVWTKSCSGDSEIKRPNTKSPAAIPPGSAWTTVSGQQRFLAKRRRPISCSGSAAQTSPSRDGIAIPRRL